MKKCYNRIYNSVDKLIQSFSVLSLTDNILASYKNKDLKESDDKIKKLSFDSQKENMNNIGDYQNEINLDITNSVQIVEEKVKYNIPYKISYNNYIFNFEGSNPEKRKKFTFHCQNYRKIKGLREKNKKFCYSKIQGTREDINSKKIKYILKTNHSYLCINLHNSNLKSIIVEKNKSNELEKLKENIITDKNEFNLELENYIKNNKENKLDCQSFIKYGFKLYNMYNLKNIFICDKIYLKNLYYRIYRKYYQLNSENIYDYAEKLSNEENFCRYISMKQLLNKENKIINHKAMIFFSDFDIKRLAFSKHLLIDGTFIYPTGFLQTIVIMYYDEIIDKMIPGIYITINNKTEERYLDTFNYIKYYLYKILEKREEQSNFETYTTDFEIALYSAFNKVFNVDNNIRQIGCYFHYLQNIRKYFQTKGLTKNIYKSFYNNIISTCKSLPFKNIKGKELINLIKNNYKCLEKIKIDKELENPQTILEEFINYFENQWLKYFEKDILNLNKLNIKFRSNNCLENFNRQLKKYSGEKKHLNLVTYVDLLMKEVMRHEDYIIAETKKPLKKISKNKKTDINLDSNFTKDYLEIAEEIMNYHYDNNNLNINENNVIYINNFDNNSNGKDIKNDLIHVEEIYKNNVLTSDIIYHSLIGIENLGVNCYFNSGLQIILHCYKFMIYIIYDIRTKINNQNSNKIDLSKSLNDFIVLMLQSYIENSNLTSLDKIYDILFRDIITCKNKLSVSPKDLLDNFSKNHPMYKNSQEDCVEFIRVFLSDLSNENNFNNSNKSYKELSYKGKSISEASIEYHNNYINKENSAVIKHFYFQIVNTFVCSCGYKTFSFDKYLDLPLLIPDEKKNYNILDLIKEHLKLKITEWKKKCENCNIYGLNHQQLEQFDMIGNYFIIYIQRINRFKRKKNQSMIEFEEDLNLIDFFYEKKN